MEYFKSGLKSVLGAPQPGAQPTGAETVSRQAKLVRVQNMLYPFLRLAGISLDFYFLIIA